MPPPDLKTAADAGQGPPRRLGVLGTLVCDTIRPLDGPPVRAWGGIAYSLAALERTLPAGWTLAPLIKVGADVADRAIAFLHSLSRIGYLKGVRVVPEANNRVELTYLTPAERVERLTGGVPGWSPGEIGSRLGCLDALYVNFVSGRELDLEAAQRIRDGLKGPAYADLHSLFLAIESDGRRTPRYLASSGTWIGCFDAVQMNETEFGLLAEGAPAPWRAAARKMSGRLITIVVTTGEQGATIMTRERSGPPEPGCTQAPGRAPRLERHPLADRPVQGDPTGCGDVWGAAFLANLLGGADRAEAAAAANALARRKLSCMGAEAFLDLTRG